MIKTRIACVFAICAGLLLSAQSPPFPGSFSPGVFTNRAALDAAPAASYTGPSDVLGATAVHFVGLRAVSAAAAASNIKLVRFVRSSDNHDCDILANAVTGKLGNTGNCTTGTENGTLWSTWCANGAGTCSFGVSAGTGLVYDQGTAALNYVVANQSSPITLNAIGGTNPTITCASAHGDWFENTTGFTQAQRLFFTMVSKRTANFTTLQRGVFAANGSSMSVGYDSSVNNLYISGINTVAASDSTFHSVGIDFNGASTQVWVDGNSQARSLQRAALQLEQ